MHHVELRYESYQCDREPRQFFQQIKIRERTRLVERLSRENTVV